MISSRTFTMPKSKSLLNVQFRETYHNYISFLITLPKITDKDYMRLCYYLILQKRIKEANEIFKKINYNNIIGDTFSSYELQYDYLTAYLDFSDETSDFKKARDICKKYHNFTIISWKNMFKEIEDQLNEYDGKINFDEEINKEQNELIFEINNINNLEDYISEKKVEYKLKLTKIKTLYNLIENKINNNILNGEFYKGIIFLIIRTIKENSSYNNLLINNYKNKNEENDNILLDELLSNVKIYISNFSIKYKEENNKKFYLKLEESINEDYNIKMKKCVIKEKSANNKSLKKNNFYISHFKNNLILKCDKNKLNLIKNKNFQNEKNTKIKENDKCIEKIKLDILRLDYLPKLNEDIKKELSFENLDLYNQTNNLLYEEYKSLNKKITIFNFKNFYNDNNNLQEIKKSIINKKNKLDKIKKECDILFNDINFGIYNSDNIKEKLKTIIQNIKQNMESRNINNYFMTTIKKTSKSYSFEKNIIRKFNNLKNISYFCRTDKKK